MREILKHASTALATGIGAGAAVVLASLAVPEDVRATMQGSAAQVAILAALFAAQIRELRERDKRHDDRLASVERKLTRLCLDADQEITARHSVPSSNGSGT